MLKKYFVNQGIKEVQIEEFIRNRFPMGDYSKIELQRTPLGLKILIYTNQPGRIIGRGGKNINEITEVLKQAFKIENPQVDVKVIEKPDLDAKIVAKQIASALEMGYNYKKIGNLTLKRIMDAGAIGAEIVISGKLGGGKGIMSKFIEGYLKHSGQQAKELVDYGFEEANTKPGKIGIKVKIMKKFVSITGEVLDAKPVQVKISEKAKEIIKEELGEEAEEAAVEEITAESPEEKPKAKAKPKPRKKKAGSKGKEKV